MQRVALLLTVMTATLVFASGLALAKAIVGTNGNDRLVGTNNNDTISGAGGKDLIFGKGDRDRLYGDSGPDRVVGGAGNDLMFPGHGIDKVFAGGSNDFVNTLDKQVDRVINCGPGAQDEAFVDFDEFFIALNGGCEKVAGISFGPAGIGTAGRQELRALPQRTYVEEKK